MIKLLSYLINHGVTTARSLCPPLDEACIGLPKLTEKPCAGTGCSACKEACPTNAINVMGQGENSTVTLDRGACISCGLCIDVCPTGTIEHDRSTRIAVRKRDDLILSNASDGKAAESPAVLPDLFNKSIAVRVVSTGCSACDAEIGASGNPIFDIDRCGISIVASPRYADALMVTGPVGKGMHKALVRCYEAMAEPRRIIAAGTCAISGGVHKGGYAAANGVDSILPVDVYIPGCPPHPWSMLHGILLSMGAEDRLE